MAWELTGNAGTNPDINFVGTTDNEPLVIKIHGGEALRIDTHGRVGIGTTNPATALHVVGQFTLDPQGTGQNDPALFTGTGPGELNRYLQLTNSPEPNAASPSGLKAGGVLIADDHAFANPGKNDLIIKGQVGVGTPNPAAALHVVGQFTLDPQGTGQNDPVLFTGTGPGELNRYLQLTNSPEPNATSPSGLKAGGVLVADDHAFANPGKNDLIVKGSVGVGGDVRMDGALTATSATIRGEVPGGSIVLDQDVNGAHVFVFSPRQVPGFAGIVQLSSAPGLPDNGAVFVTDAAGSATGITAKAGMFVDDNGRGVVMADIKNFRAPHPAQPDTDIVYACVEGPEAAVYVRGTGQLVDGEARIFLPDHFVSVANVETMTVHVTPLSADSLGLSVVAKRLGDFIVRELHRGAGTYNFDWEVKAVRKGHEDYRVTRPRSEAAMSAQR
jgi:hypothetical protein